MKEQLISFKTAKLAKEKGFDLYQSNQYSKGVNPNTLFDYTFDQCILFDDVYYAPTQSLLQKWLRDKHKIHIEVHSRHSSWIFFIFELSNWNRECLLNIDWYGTNEYLISKNIPTILKTYEEALETGLQQALKYIE